MALPRPKYTTVDPFFRKTRIVHMFQPTQKSWLTSVTFRGVQGVKHVKKIANFFEASIIPILNTFREKPDQNLPFKLSAGVRAIYKGHKDVSVCSKIKRSLTQCEWVTLSCIELSSTCAWRTGNKSCDGQKLLLAYLKSVCPHFHNFTPLLIQLSSA